MARILRGDIYWADLSPAVGHEQTGRHPVLVISQDIFNEKSGTVIALAITGSRPRAGYPLTYSLSRVSLPKESWVKTSQIRTLSVKRIGQWLARIDPEQLKDIVAGLNEIIGG